MHVSASERAEVPSLCTIGMSGSFVGYVNFSRGSMELNL